MAGKKKVSKKATGKKSGKKATISSQADLHASIDPRDREKAIAAVTQDPRALTLENLGWPFTEDREVVLAAVNVWGGALRGAAKALQGDREIVLAAVMQDGDALELASEELQQDEELKKIAEG